MGSRKWKASKIIKESEFSIQIDKVQYLWRLYSAFLKKKKLSYILDYLSLFLILNDAYVVMSCFSLLILLEVAIIKFIFERIGPLSTF